MREWSRTHFPRPHISPIPFDHCTIPCDRFGMIVRCNKARRDGYDPPPFYYIDRQEDYARIAVWTPNAEQMSGLVWALLQRFPGNVDVLLKLPRDEEHPLDGWYQRYHGVVPLALVQEVIARHLNYVFQVGGDVLCLRKEDELEYLALDEFGTLFYYTDSEETWPLFEACGFVQEQHPFVSEGEAYLQRFDDQGTWLESFIRELGLSLVTREPMPEV